jgi:hypothetical protein
MRYNGLVKKSEHCPPAMLLKTVIITYQGGNYFKLQAGQLIILVDPTNHRSEKGTDVILSTVKPAEITPEDGPVFIDHQGEYEVKHILITGVSAGGSEPGKNRKEETFYVLDFDEIKIGIVGQLTHEPDPKTLAALKGVQVLIVPAGGKPFVSQATAAKIVRHIEPNIVIPTLFRDLKPFLKEFKKTSCDTEDKLVIKAKDLKPGMMEIKCLKP